MIPFWINALAVVALLLGLASAVVIVIDELREPQQMWIMNLVWPVAALFGSLPWLWGYFRYGRLGSRRRVAAAGAGRETPFAMMVAKGASHCGAGCTIGDVLAEWLAFFVPAVAVWFGWHSLFADKMFAVWILDFIFAFAIGVAFQYFTIAPMRGLGLRDGLVAALKADTLSLAAWQVGMYGFMAFAKFYLFGTLLGAELEVASPSFWFMMQLAMLCGFATSYPVNWWLLRTGLKEKM